MDIQVDKISSREKKLAVIFSDNTEYLIPAWVIAHHKAMHYASNKLGRLKSEYYYKEFSEAIESSEDLIVWAKACMDWKEVEIFAVLVPREGVKLVPGDMWKNAKMKVI